MKGSARPGLLAVIGPGLVIAATGVGAGDLATAGLAGAAIGLSVLWAVCFGAVMKFVLTEGLARWQLATGRTLLEGAVDHLGRGAAVIFLIYLLPFSYVVGAALISACGVTSSALFPIFEDPAMGQFVFGAILSVVGLVLVWVGRYAIFERIMAVCVAVMFLIVVVTAVLIANDWAGIARGIFVPTLPMPGDEAATKQFGWVIKLIGGVGGTVTLLCYGYWIREAGRDQPSDISICRIDLAVGYAVTALFGIAIVIISNGMEAQGKGANLILNMANQLGAQVGSVGRWAFLIGAWAAVFSSLLGVWQAIPFLFSDAVERLKSKEENAGSIVNTRKKLYRLFLLALAVVPLIQVARPFAELVTAYAVFGAFFLPLLALVLMLLNSRRRWIGYQMKNGPLATIGLLLTLLFFLFAASIKLGLFTAN